MVSCTILPTIEMSSSKVSRPVATTSVAAGSSSQNPILLTDTRNLLSMIGNNGEIFVKTNLGRQFRIVQTLVKKDNTLTRLYSVTAL